MGDVDAARAALEAGADVLVAQGGEAVRQQWMDLHDGPRPVGGRRSPVTRRCSLRAGIADGRGNRGQRSALGAHGAWLGTQVPRHRTEMTDRPGPGRTASWPPMPVMRYKVPEGRAGAARRSAPAARSGLPSLRRVLRTPLADAWLAEDRRRRWTRTPCRAPRRRGQGRPRGHDELPFDGTSRAELVARRRPEPTSCVATAGAGDGPGARDPRPTGAPSAGEPRSRRLLDEHHGRPPRRSCPPSPSLTGTARSDPAPVVGTIPGAPCDVVAALRSARPRTSPTTRSRASVPLPAKVPRWSGARAIGRAARGRRGRGGCRPRCRGVPASGRWLAHAVRPRASSGRAAWRSPGWTGPRPPGPARRVRGR